MAYCRSCHQTLLTYQYGLTPRMKETLSFIEGYIDANDGISPSFQEIMDECDFASKSNVHKVVNSLMERGYIVYAYGRSRSIVLTQRVAA